MTRKKEKLGTVLFCMIFVLTFGAVGAGAWWVIGATIHDGMRAKEWVRVKAELVSYDQGNVSYKYKFGDRQYSGDRLGSNAVGGTDDIDGWHHDMNEYLNDARTGSKPLMVWVNPDNPAESMVDREIRWKFLVFALVFGLTFGGVGLGALIAGIVSLFPKRQGKGRRKRSGAGATVAGLWLFAFFWNAIAFPVSFLTVPEMIADGAWMGLLIMIFPLIGLMILWAAIHATWGLLRRGGADLVLSGDKPQPGRPLSGHIAFAKGVKAGQNFRVRLEARDASDDGNSLRTVWSKEVKACVANSGGGPRITFRFDPPANVRADSWRLEAIAPGRAAEVKYGFDVAMQPAPEEDLVPVAAAFDDEPMPAALGPGLEHVEKMLNGAGVKLTRDQMGKFKELMPEQRAQVAKLVKWAPTAKKAVIWVFGIYIAVQLAGLIVSLLAD
ncbi:MAG: DUF3592 domain-containing protein [Pseudomonadota bacterium]|nr:DUF3592 domain-containing protein [Pseudomonadota bacterium]